MTIREYLCCCFKTSGRKTSNVVVEGTPVAEEEKRASQVTLEPTSTHMTTHQESVANDRSTQQQEGPIESTINVVQEVTDNTLNKVADTIDTIAIKTPSPAEISATASNALEQAAQACEEPLSKVFSVTPTSHAPAVEGDSHSHTVATLIVPPAVESQAMSEATERLAQPDTTVSVTDIINRLVENQTVVDAQAKAEESNEKAPQPSTGNDESLQKEVTVTDAAPAEEQAVETTTDAPTDQVIPESSKVPSTDDIQQSVVDGKGWRRV